MNTKALIAALGLAASLFGAPILQAQTQPVDQVVAIVDDDIIMASELRERVAPLR